MSHASGIQYANGVLTDAQIKALPTTPTTLVAAPGATYGIKPFGMRVQLKATSAVYTNINATYVALQVMWGVAGEWATTPLLNDSTTTNPMNRFSTLFGSVYGVHNGHYDFAIPYMESDASWWTPQVRVPGDYVANNAALVMDIDNNGSGNLTGGNPAQSLYWDLWYAIVRTGP